MTLMRYAMRGQRRFLQRSFTTTNAAASPSRVLSIGIRREDKNIWERRTPLMPEDVSRLIRETGTNVLVQPSTNRIVPDESYKQAGAIITPDLTSTDIIMGIKEVPPSQLIPNKTYMFFSHTHKGQPASMPMLRHVVEKGIQLVDYELMVDGNGKRIVQFSRFAGYAGMIDGLHVLGKRLLSMGFGTPFLNIAMSYKYRSLTDARMDVLRTGMDIMDSGIPRELGPMTFVFTGDGNVSSGARHVFGGLPHVWIEPKDLKTIATNKDFDHKKVYACLVRPQDYLIKKDKSGSFNRDEYMQHPDRYESVFHETIAPYTRVLINGIFWTPSYPRLLTVSQTRRLAETNQLKLYTVADISCDINGSLEFMGKASTISDPVYMVQPVTGAVHHDMSDRVSIPIMSIDNLPTEMALESSQWFSQSLYSVVKDVLVAGSVDGCRVTKDAKITEGDGQIVKKLRAVVEPALLKHGAASHPSDKKSDKKHKNERHETDGHASIKVDGQKRVLVLGSGYVVPPILDRLSSTDGRAPRITIASNQINESRQLKRGRDNINVVAPVNVMDQDAVGRLIKDTDIVVSMVPATMHPSIAKLCIDHGKDMVTASYVSDDMKRLDTEARRRGIVLMNEVGLDPGIDHLTACQVFDEVKQGGGRIRGFMSWCGGLPAPECSMNPFGYKFSWSPKGVLKAGFNNARYKLNGQLVNIDGSKLLDHVMNVDIMNGFAFEGLANRDSIKYVDVYGLGPIEDMETMMRGTLRYRGYSEMMSAFGKIGLMRDDEMKEIRDGLKWKDLIAIVLGTRDIRVGVKSKLHGANDAKIDKVVDAMAWLGMLSDDGVDSGARSVMDAVCGLMEKKMAYESGERDMVAMHHEFGIEWGDGKREKRTSTLILYGDAIGTGGYSAMAKTVGWPVAIATEMVLRGDIKKGVVVPMDRVVYEPMMRELSELGIKFEERSMKV